MQNEKVKRSAQLKMFNNFLNHLLLNAGVDQTLKIEQVRPAGQAGYPISLVVSLDTVPVKCCVPLPFSALRNYMLVAIPGALSSKPRGPSSVLCDSKP